ncbi:DUF397 domain-containing protein [Nocardiopsis chromatogenes]|uniref:DUF397 domain-containing protein n=1 Tax=Nocardiopsis chromatogenes TaxID=280239 RepID=UPI000A00C234|nr:DUF397 domain-containing protein [Nocardiopsis chromatogenes]
MLTSDWNKASYSRAQGECVRARLDEEEIQVGDTRNPEVLGFPASEWLALLKSLQ